MSDCDSYCVCEALENEGILIDAACFRGSPTSDFVPGCRMRIPIVITSLAEHVGQDDVVVEGHIIPKDVVVEDLDVVVVEELDVVTVAEMRRHG